MIAALSQRIVGLDPTVSKCINKMDFTALRAKLLKARDMFMMCDVHGTVCRCRWEIGVLFWQGIISLDQLRIEMKAGGISKEHEDDAIGHMEQEGQSELNFLDFMVGRLNCAYQQGAAALIACRCISRCSSTFTRKY